MIYYSIPDRAILYNQSNDRLHRLTSTEDVFIYRLILKGSVDEWARNLVDYKNKVNNGMISEKDFKSVAEMSLFKFLGIDKKTIV